MNIIRIMNFVSVLLSIAFLLFSCENQEDQNNLPPTCKIIAPKEEAEITKDEVTTISVEAEDNDGEIEEVRFFVNGIGVGSSTQFPYNYEWDTEDLDFGNYTVSATSFDDENMEAKDSIDIKIVNHQSTVTDIDGNTYGTVIIGEQEWMSENLRVTTYNDGTPIDLETDDNSWGNLTTGAYCWYNNDKSEYGKNYGALYNYNAVETKKLCPDGWHVPSDEEWKELESFLGMNVSELNAEGLRGSNEGSQLAGLENLWTDGTLTENEEFDITSFKAVPAGRRGSDGSTYLGEYNQIWTSTVKEGELVWFRGVHYTKSKIERGGGMKMYGFSVRCLKD